MTTDTITPEFIELEMMTMYRDWEDGKASSPSVQDFLMIIDVDYEESTANTLYAMVCDGMEINLIAHWLFGFWQVRTAMNEAAK